MKIKNEKSTVILHTLVLVILFLSIAIGMEAITKHETQKQHERCETMVEEYRQQATSLAQELDELKEELCDAGAGFCGDGATLKITPCSEEGRKVCAPLFNGEFCKTYYCDPSKGDITGFIYEIQ